MAAEAEVVVVGRRVCRRDAVEGVHAAVFGRAVEFAAELVATVVDPAAVEFEFAAHTAVGGITDAEDVVFVFVHGQLTFNRHGFALAVRFVVKHRFGEVATALQVLLQGGDVGGKVGLAGFELDEALQQVRRERHVVEFNAFKGVAHAAVEDERDVGAIGVRVYLDAVFAEGRVKVAARAGECGKARLVGFVGVVVKRCPRFERVFGEQFAEFFVALGFAGDLYVHLAEFGRGVLRDGVDDGEAVGAVVELDIHLGVVVAEGLLRAADFFAAVFDEVLHVIRLVDGLIDDFFQREIDFGVVVLGFVRDAADVDFADGFAFKPGGGNRWRGRLRCGCGIFFHGNGCGCFFGSSRRSRFFTGSGGRFGRGFTLDDGGGQGEQAKAECGNQRFGVHGVIPVEFVASAGRARAGRRGRS